MEDTQKLKYRAKLIDGKLMLTSSDIQVGDTCLFHHLQGEGEIIEDIVDEVDGDTIWIVDGPNVDIKHCYKVIGKISPDATWVKEGDEFDEYEQLWRDSDGILWKSKEISSLNGYTGEYDSICRVKGPCGYFH